MTRNGQTLEKQNTFCLLTLIPASCGTFAGRLTNGTLSFPYYVGPGVPKTRGNKLGELLQYMQESTLCNWMVVRRKLKQCQSKNKNKNIWFGKHNLSGMRRCGDGADVVEREMMV